MTTIQALLFLFLGAGLVLVAWRSLRTGWLPCGPNGLRGRLELTRARQPLGYWLMFCGYALAGLWLLGFALRLLAGTAEPLPLN